MADRMAFHADRAVFLQFDPEQRRVLGQGLHQHGGAAIDEALGQPGVQRVGQAGFDRLGASGHLVLGHHPVGSLGDVGPAADGRDSALQRVDIALGIVELGDARGGEIGAEPALPQILPQPRNKAGMGFRALLAEIGKRTGLPEPSNQRWPLDAIARWFVGKPLEHGKVDRFGGGCERRVVGLAFQILDQRGERIEARLRIAPVEPGQRSKAMFLHRVDFLIGQRQRPTVRPARQRAEGAILLVASGASGDLGDFGGRQPPLPHSVELGQPGKGDMVDVKVQPHPDRIGGNDVINLARLEQFHLPVARFRAERTHYHRRPAPEAAQHFRHGIDLLDREGDDRAARG